MRALHDETGIGLALVGNEMVYAKLSGGGGVRATYLAQLYSRVGKRLHLTRPTAGDISVLCKPWELKKAELAYLTKIAAKAGALRGVVKTYNLAKIMALGEETQLELRHLKAAWADLGGCGF